MPSPSVFHTIAARPPTPVVRGYRVWLGEVAGAFGDIGTFIPLLIGVKFTWRFARCSYG